jgi:hypothetical protein
MLVGCFWDHCSVFNYVFVQQEEQLQKELNTLREDHAALRKTLEVQTEQSQVGTYGLLQLRLIADSNKHKNE